MQIENIGRKERQVRQIGMRDRKYRLGKYNRKCLKVDKKRGQKREIEKGDRYERRQER